MSRQDRLKATPEQKAEYQRQYGIVVLAAIFGGFIVADLIIVLNGPIEIAVPAAAVFGILLGLNVLRYLRRKAAKEQAPDA